MSSKASCTWYNKAFSIFLHSKYDYLASAYCSFNCNALIAVKFKEITDGPGYIGAIKGCVFGILAYSSSVKTNAR